MQILIRDRKELEFLVGSDLNDDSFYLEVRFNDSCLFAFIITDDGTFEIVFGLLKNYNIDLDLFEQIISEAKQILIKKQTDWLNSPDGKK